MGVLVRCNGFFFSYFITCYKGNVKFFSLVSFLFESVPPTKTPYCRQPKTPKSYFKTTHPEECVVNVCVRVRGYRSGLLSPFHVP